MQRSANVLYMVKLIPLQPVPCFVKIEKGSFYFLVLTYQGFSEQEASKWMLLLFICTYDKYQRLRF